MIPETNGLGNERDWMVVYRWVRRSYTIGSMETTIVNKQDQGEMGYACSLWQDSVINRTRYRDQRAKCIVQWQEVELIPLPQIYGRPRLFLPSLPLVALVTRATEHTGRPLVIPICLLDRVSSFARSITTFSPRLGSDPFTGSSRFSSS